MALSQQDYFKQANESIDQYNARIASLQNSNPSQSSTSPTPSSLPSDTAGLQNVVNQAAKTVQNLTSQVQSITNPVPANTIKPVTSPTLPEPQAPAIVNSYIGGIQQNLQTSRAALDNSIQSQRDQLAQQQKQLQDQIDSFNTKEQSTIQNDIQPLLAPFRQQLEDSQRSKFQVEENYADNQKTINEIETLANGLQQDILNAQSTPAPAAILEGKVGQIKQDALARIGVLQAVVSMRNGQISTAENFIDRSVQAITADRQDQLNYYNTILKFYDTQKDEAGNKLIDVKKQDLDALKSQQALLENDMKEAQTNFDSIKQMMLDPAKADIIARAGVKLTDTPQQVAQKISTYNYGQEKSDLQNQFALKGYSLLPFPEQAAGKDPSQLLRVVDSQGKEMIFYNPSATSSGITLGTGTVAQRNNNPGNIKVSDYSLNLFKDLGANASSTQATDGGSFLTFPTPEAGFQAMGRLLKSGTYADMRVGDALSKWSNGGYGANVAQAAGVDPNAFVRDLPANQLQSLTQTMAKQEGFYNSGSTPQISAIQNALDALTAGLTKDQRTSVTGAISSAVNRGDIDTARQTLLSTAISALPLQQQNSAFGRAVAIQQLDKVQGLLNQYVAAGGSTNVLKGSEEKIFQKLGSTSNPALANIGNQVKAAIIDYRHAVSGAAFTEAEAKQYESMFPSASNIPELNTALISSLKDVFQSQQTTVLSQVLGGRNNYESLFGQQPSNITQPTLTQNTGTTSSGVSWQIVQ